MPDPRIGPADLSCWSSWQATVAIHARTRLHALRVDGARSVIGDLLDKDSNPAIMWSGGKDSTAMAHLAVQMCPGLELMSEKDDLDYPGEREYVESLAAAWNAHLTVLVPDVSPAQWMAAHACEIAIGGDVHGRAAGLSKACFYSVVERASGGRAIMLGLRSEESAARRVNRATHGRLYQARGQLVATPIADWMGLDVYAYLLTNGIDPLPLYRCIALMHRREPWRLRKSWWVQGAAGSTGGVQWLRHYYPSLYAKLVEWSPRTQSLGA
jgi:3'-phosphoadenosine 5'-phosphosulfate sulfotransferase (PAPS reductase)/FAD synthetase